MGSPGEQILAVHSPDQLASQATRSRQRSTGIRGSARAETALAMIIGMIPMAFGLGGWGRQNALRSGVQSWLGWLLANCRHAHSFVAT